MTLSIVTVTCSGSHAPSISNQEGQFGYKHVNDDALFMVTTSERKEERVGRAHRTQDTVGVGRETMQAGGTGTRMRGGGGGGGVLERVEGRWHSPMVQTCWGRVLRTKRYIYIFCVLPHLESTPLGRVEHQEALEEVLAVCGHVEGDAVLPSQHALPQLLQKEEGQAGGETGTGQKTSWRWTLGVKHRDVS